MQCDANILHLVAHCQVKSAKDCNYFISCMEDKKLEDDSITEAGASFLS